MFFVDKPYVSDFFKKTVKENNIPVAGTKMANNINLPSGTNVINEKDVIEILKQTENPIIYTTSENSIEWIAKYLKFSHLPEKIELFKNKFKFRELTKSFFPNFFYQEIQFDDLKKINVDDLPFPFIMKPTIGFFSMGVYKVSGSDEWENTKNLISAEIEQIKDLYPREVLDTQSFIIEQCIQGDEYAIDAYYNSEGAPVILSIFKHAFSSESDVSDRVYISSKEIIENNLEEFTDFILKIGELAQVKNFPVHIELRRDGDGTLQPVEINPMRFGGWCTTADVTSLAYGFNPYLYYYHQEKPNWSKLLKDKEKKLYSIIVLDNSTGIDTNEIESFDYKKLLSNFENPLELRKIDFKKYPVFGFLFTETREDHFIEIEHILNSDLTEYISTRV